MGFSSCMKRSKALLDELALHYLHAHQIALRTERAAVEAEGLPWREYNAFTKKHEKRIDDEGLSKIPADLDLTPYRNEHDFSKAAANDRRNQTRRVRRGVHGSRRPDAGRRRASVAQSG